jgi:hypothetical protein
MCRCPKLVKLLQDGVASRAIIIVPVRIMYEYGDTMEQGGGCDGAGVVGGRESMRRVQL